MSFLKKLGQAAGEVTGLVLGGTVRVVGEVTGSGFIKEIGDSVEKATVVTGKTLGNAASGVWDAGAGLIKQDKEQLDEGLHDIKDAVGSTVKGIGQGIGYVYDNGKDVVNGLREQDKELAKEGAKNLVKAAAVGALAIGVVDVLDGPDGMEAAGDGDGVE
ncbi:MAG: hypothetical protein K0R57_2646 [Paenibacillaceae bacterium]|nr:hypothetical protein [Paenibacillaceae bacterium]